MKEKDIIGYEIMGGWPIYKQSLKDILLALGATEDDGLISFKADDPILSMYPRTLEDDGMGYGINEKYIVESFCDRKDIILNMFIERPWTEEEMKDYKKSFELENK